MEKGRTKSCACRTGGVAILLAVAALGIGCSSKSADKTKSDSATAEQNASFTAEELLTAMIAAYRDAPGYRDRGRLQLSYKVEDRVESDIAPLSVNFAKENRLRLEAYQVTLAADGKLLLGAINDAATGNMDGQFVRRPLDGELTLDWLYEDAVIASLLNRGMGRQPITLELLLSESPLELFRKPESKRALLEERSLDGRTCRRLQVETEEGRFVLWIEKESLLLLRMEYPTAAIEADLKQRYDAREVQLLAEFFDASFEAPPETRFTLQGADDVKIVQQFVTPPQPLPSNLFGRKPADFDFVDPNTGETVDGAELQSQATSLLWVSDHPAGEQSVKLLEQLRASSDPEKHRFILVCTDPKETSDDQVLEMVDRWGWQGQVVRDAKAVGRDVFDIKLLPTLVVLDPDGVLQVFDEGLNPNLASDLSAVLAMLDRGEDVAASVIQQAENERLRYEAALIREGVRPDAARATPPVEFREATIPFEFPWKPAWKVDALKAPGNVLAFANSDTIWINEGWRSIVEIDPRTGGVTRTISLDLPDGASVSRLATPHGKLRGAVFAASDLLGKQAFVFDSQWKRLLSYPPAGVKHAGVRDVGIEDLNDDGQWQLAVGFWELLGVHGVEASGERKWGNRECGSVQSVVIGAPSSIGWRQWLVIGDTGRIHQLNHHGNAEPTVTPRTGLVEQLFSARAERDARGESAYLAIGTTARGRTVWGLDAQFREVWAYDNLPEGAYDNRLNFVASGRIRLGGKLTPAWVLAGPDGSVHLISHDGAFNDFFYAGKAIDGVALWDDGAQSRLILVYGGEVVAVDVAVE